MSFIKRLKNVIEAKANKVLDKHEDPIEMLELSIKKKEELLTNAKKQCANFIATVDSIRDEKNALEEKINKYEEATKAAILKEDTEKAQSFVKQKLDLQEKLNQTNSRMKSKKQELATRLDVAQINNEINETLAGLNDDHGINLDELEKKVSQKENYGKALDELKPKNEDELLDEYIKSSPSVDSKVAEELERIKEQMKK